MTSGNEMIPAASGRMRRRENAITATTDVAPVAPRTAASPTPRWSRRRGVLGVFAAFCALGFVAAYVGPTGAALAEAGDDSAAATVSIYGSSIDEAQSFVAASDEPDAAADTLDRGGYTVYVTPKPKPPVVATTKTASSSSPSRPLYSGGGSKTEWLLASGIAEGDWAYVDYIVSKESGWNPNATNKSSGACGLVQALPCSKVPGNGYDPVDNLRWANGYAVNRYGSWAGAYAFWTAKHWW